MYSRWTSQGCAVPHNTEVLLWRANGVCVCVGGGGELSSGMLSQHEHSMCQQTGEPVAYTWLS
jgi:hypothetical protein